MSDGVPAAVTRLSLTVNSLPLGHAERWGHRTLSIAACPPGREQALRMRTRVNARAPIPRRLWSMQAILSNRHGTGFGSHVPARTRAVSALTSFATRFASFGDRPSSNRMSSSASERGDARRTVWSQSIDSLALQQGWRTETAIWPRTIIEYMHTGGLEMVVWPV